MLSGNTLLGNRVVVQIVDFSEWYHLWRGELFKFEEK